MVAKPCYEIECDIDHNFFKYLTKKKKTHLVIRITYLTSFLHNLCPYY